MILKFLEAGNGLDTATWTFLDHVTHVTAGIDGEEGRKFITYNRDEKYFTQDVTNGCYLLNDMGRTIERLV